MLNESNDFETVCVSLRDNWNPPCRHYHIPFRRIPYKLNILMAYMKFRSILSAEKPDLVHAHFLTPFSIMTIKSSVPSILSLWGSDATGYYPDSGFILKKLYDRAVIQSAALFSAGKHLPEILNTRSQRTEEIIWGTDTSDIDRDVSFREQFKIPEKSFVITNIRIIRDIFQIERVIKAVINIKKKGKDVHLVLIRGPYTDYNNVIENLCRGLDFITILDNLNNDDFRKLLRCSDIALSLALRDGSPVSVKEAMAAGLPVIYQNTLGINNTIDERFGIEMKTHDDSELEIAIIRLMTDTTLRDRLSSDAVIFAKEHYDEKTQWSKALDIYMDVINGSH